MKREEENTGRHSSRVIDVNANTCLRKTSNESDCYESWIQIVARLDRLLRLIVLRPSGWFGVGLLSFLLLAGLSVQANDIQASNVRLMSAQAPGTTLIQFDLSWKNSWRHPFSTGINNWDAAWVFVKYRTPVSVGGDGLWKHARLNNSGHTAGSGMTVETGLLTPGTAYDATNNPGLGVFIYRSEPGRGDINLTGVRLAWDYSAAGLAETALLEVQVFAIEMVYVPQGSFFVGTGANPVEANSFTQANNTSGATVPFQITSTPPTIQGNNASSSSSNLGARGGMDLNGTGTTTASLASGFPTGFAAFNMMKYSITQQQYVDFLNTLTSTQASRREYTGGSSRNAISVSGGVYATTNPFVANNLISWMDGAAYMDWAGLRPMTELEYEKAARGSLNPVANEYAWGTATIAALPYTLSNAGAENEAIATNYSLTAGNAIYTSTQGIIGGPVRVGIFGTATSNRVQSGASFWGIMELSGNLWERPVTVGNATGRAFTGLHGDGALSTAGYANVAAWPGLSSGEVTEAVGSGLRGGAWTNDATFLRASDRLIAANEVTTGTNNYGFRGVRTAGCVNGASAPTIDTTGGLSPSQVSPGQLATYKVSGSGSYMWIVPNDWSIVSGQGTNEIKVIIGATFPGTVRVAEYNACGAGVEANIEVARTLEPYPLVLDAFFDATAQERYVVRLGISTTRDANLLFRTRPVPGEVNRQMRFDNSFFDTRDATLGSFVPHTFTATGQPDGEFLATIRGVPANHTIIIFEMIADDFPNGSTTFKFELEVYDIDRGEVVFSQILEEEYLDL